MKFETHRLRVLLLITTRIFRKTYMANTCGHRTKRTGEIRALGEEYIISMPLEKNGNPAYCLDCIATMSIRCAHCGKPIHIGEPITLYGAFAHVPEGAVRYHLNNRSYVVGCLRWGCADSGADRQGFWTIPGRVERVPTAIKMVMIGTSERDVNTSEE